MYAFCSLVACCEWQTISHQFLCRHKVKVKYIENEEDGRVDFLLARDMARRGIVIMTIISLSSVEEECLALLSI